MMRCVSRARSFKSRKMSMVPSIVVREVLIRPLLACKEFWAPVITVTSPRVVSSTQSSES